MVATFIHYYKVISLRRKSLCNVNIRIIRLKCTPHPSPHRDSYQLHIQKKRPRKYYIYVCVMGVPPLLAQPQVSLLPGLIIIAL